MISGRNKRNHVRAYRELEAGKDLFGASRSAEHVAAFEHENFLARARQISGVDQAVVASANHDYIVFRTFDAIYLFNCRQPRRISRAVTGLAQKLVGSHEIASWLTPLRMTSMI